MILFSINVRKCGKLRLKINEYLSFNTRSTIHLASFHSGKIAPEVIAIQKGKGSYLYDEKGTAYLDLICSWWVNLHGHGNLVIAERVYQQALQLGHIMFAGFTHKPAEQLCEELREILPDSLCRFFFPIMGPPPQK